MMLMDQSDVYLLFLVAGAFSGLTAGLFGIGGGLVMVPALLVSFTLAGVPPNDLVPMALGTSLACVGFTSFMAARAHFELGNLARPLSVRVLGFSACLAVGVFIGSEFSTSVPRNTILGAIGFYQLFVACWMLWTTIDRAHRPAPESHDPEAGIAAMVAPNEMLSTNNDPRVDDLSSITISPKEPEWTPPEDLMPAQNKIGQVGGAFFFAAAGAVSSVAGTGAATLMIPFFAKVGIPFRKAAALSSCFGCAVGILGALAYAFISTPDQHLAMSVGYVNIPAFISLSAGSFFLVRYGARVSMRVSPKNLARGFCAFLLLSSSAMLAPMAMRVFA